MFKTSLQNLRVFESAGRNRSFRAAAEELHLSVSAISHAIRKMEQALGTPLFLRAGRGVQLSSEGEALLRFVSRGFDEIARGMELVGAREKEVLRIHSAPSFAAQWLTPRLVGFMEQHPGLSVRLSASTVPVRFPNEEFDLDITYGQPLQPGVVVVPLGQETLTPLCAPRLATTIQDPRDLVDRVLIDSDVNQLRWSDWLRANGVLDIPARVARFDRSFLSISAAVEGLGIALESTRLAEREIREGRLIRPLAGLAIDLEYTANFLVFPAAARQRAGLRIFVRWLADALALPLGEGSLVRSALEVSTGFPAISTNLS